MIDMRLMQPAKAPSPISVTELGIVTEVRFEQPEKAHPILVTELGIVIEVAHIRHPTTSFPLSNKPSFCSTSISL